MNLHIAVCDDEKTEAEYLAGLVRDWAASRKISAAVPVFDSAEAFLFAYEADKSADILLLDIQMGGLDGVTLAKRLRAGGAQMQIVFITALPDFIAEGYEVSALHYLIKPVAAEKLFSVLDRAVEVMEKAEKYILIETDSGQVRLALPEVRYAEAFAHTVHVQTAAEGFEVRLPIGELEGMLGGGFFRCHRSYIVGLDHVRQITKTDIVMDDGRRIPLSRRRYDAANRAFIQYYRGAE